MHLRLLPFCPARTSKVAEVLARSRRRRSMMRTLIAAMLLVMVALVSPWLWALDEAKDKGVGEGLAERIQDLNLTDDQEAKIADIRKECRPKVQKASKGLAAIGKDEVGKVRAVLTEKQKKTLLALKKERRLFRGEHLVERIAHLQELDLTGGERTKIAAIRKEYHPQVVKTMEGLKGLLTAEQRKAREAGLKAGKKRREVIASLKLTDKQKEKVEAIGKEVRTLVREELEKIRDVLTEGQKEKLQDFKEERQERVRDRMAHRIANLKELNLTDEQKSQIADIRKEYRPKIQEAGNKLRGAVREEVEAIVAVLKE
jgi:Spy/CpxP family protein refolding chaperone